MRYLLTVVLATGLATLSAWGTEPPAQADDASGLIALEHAWVEALQKNDVRTLSTIFASTYVDTDETGHRADKTAVLGALSPGRWKLARIELSDMKPVIYGHAAVVTGGKCAARDLPRASRSRNE